MATWNYDVRVDLHRSISVPIIGLAESPGVDCQANLHFDIVLIQKDGGFRPCEVLATPALLPRSVQVRCQLLPRYKVRRDEWENSSSELDHDSLFRCILRTRFFYILSASQQTPAHHPDLTYSAFGWTHEPRLNSTCHAENGLYI